MSYAKFNKDLSKYLSDWKREDIETVDRYETMVRDEWLQSGREIDLIKYVHQNWDTPQADPTKFIQPLRTQLVANNNLKLIVKLFDGIIKIRTDDLWFYVPQLENKDGILNQKHLEDRKAIVNSIQASALYFIEMYLNDLAEITIGSEDIVQNMSALKFYVGELKKPRPKNFWRSEQL